MKMVGRNLAMLVFSVFLCSAAMAPAAYAQNLPDIPMGQDADADASLLPEGLESDDFDLFGIRGGFVHPYISLSGEYTDNLYNLRDDKTSNFLIRISPGVWFSLPRTKQIPITITPHNTSPGGLQLQIKDYEGTDRYQAYALAGLDYNAYSEDSDLNDTDARLEGLYRYNMRGGLSLQVLDRFTYGQDRFEIGSASRGNLRRYTSNLFMGTADYNITQKLRFKFDYSNFMLDYDDEINEPLDRYDNVFDLYGYYIYSLKTSLFLQYRFTDVSYDSADEKDNYQNYIYGGITWDTTEKLSLLFKLGSQDRSYDSDPVAGSYDWSGFAFDLQTLYRWTEKTQFSLDMYRKSEESDSAVAIDKVVLGARFGYRQNITEKLNASIDFIYESADYTQTIATSRDDDRYYFRPALQYYFRKWLMTELAYVYDKRESTDDLFDYVSNTGMLSINLSM